MAQGGQAILFVGADGIRCRGAQLGARWALLILRKHSGSFRMEFITRRCFLRPPPFPPGHKFIFAQESDPQK
jgi:hypothetical protein